MKFISRKPQANLMTLKGQSNSFIKKVYNEILNLKSSILKYPIFQNFLNVLKFTMAKKQSNEAFLKLNDDLSKVLKGCAIVTAVRQCYFLDFAFKKSWARFNSCILLFIRSFNNSSP